MRYVIEEIKGMRVVRRRKSEDESVVMAPKATEEPKVQRVVKRRMPPAPAKPEVRASKPAKVTKPAKARTPKPRVPKPRAAKARAVAAAAYPSGQNGPAIDLTVDDFNTKERRLLDALNGAGRGERAELSIAEAGSAAFAREPVARGMSWVRNSLRRLVRAGYVEKCKRGCYRVTDTGRRRLSKAG